VVQEYPAGVPKRMSVGVDAGLAVSGVFRRVVRHEVVERRCDYSGAHLGCGEMKERVRVPGDEPHDIPAPRREARQ